MKHLVTGGAGFIGRWVVRELLGRPGDQVVVLDDFSNSKPSNLSEFESAPNLKVVEGSVADRAALDRLWKDHGAFDTVFHLAASIRVQDSIDAPRETFTNDVIGTFELLERSRRQYFEANGLPLEAPFHLREAEGRLRTRAPRFLFMSTCMVYAPLEGGGTGIAEGHPESPSSPYSASKLAGEKLALSYHNSYRMPVTVVRPFNTYGPFQKGNLEGGVVAIFIARDLRGEPLLVKGDGLQTRDLLFVEDCAKFVVQAGLSEAAVGHVLNAGSGRDIRIRDLAELVSSSAVGGHGVPVRHVAHDHPQAEIAKLLCDSGRAKRELNWSPAVSLEEGIRRTREWLKDNLQSI